MPIVLPAKGLAKPFYKSADGAGGQYNTESLLTLYDILLSFFPTEDTEKKRPQRPQRSQRRKDRRGYRENSVISVYSL